MNTRSRVIIGGVVVVLLAVLAYFVYTINFSEYKWGFQFTELKTAHPYSLSTAFTLMDDGFGEIKTAPRNWEKIATQTDVQGLVLIGEGFLCSAEEADSVLNWVAEGHTFFASVRILPRAFSDQLTNRLCNQHLAFSSHFEPATSFRLVHPSFDTLNPRLSILNRSGYANYFQWTYFSGSALQCRDEAVTATGEAVFDPYDYESEEGEESAGGWSLDTLGSSAQTTILGYNNEEYINFIRVALGAGSVFLHTNPEAFTNLSLDSLENYHYFKAVVGHLPSERLLWDIRHLKPEFLVAQSNYARKRTMNKELGDNPQMAYIFNQPPLKWAWYCLVGMLVAFLVFNTRRRQRIIPVLAEKRNTSIALIQSIGRLTFNQQNHKEVALETYDLFIASIRHRYQLPTDDFANDHFLKTLAQRTGIEEEHFRKIGRLKRNIESSNYVSEHTLVSIYTLIDYFYQNRK